MSDFSRVAGKVWTPAVLHELRERMNHDRLQPEVGLDVDTDIANFRKRVIAMREERASTWGDITIELPPPPSNAGDDKEPQRISAADLERKAREERRRIASASSGGPLKRVESL